LLQNKNPKLKYTKIINYLLIYHQFLRILNKVRITKTQKYIILMEAVQIINENENMKTEPPIYDTGIEITL